MLKKEAKKVQPPTTMKAAEKALAAVYAQSRRGKPAYVPVAEHEELQEQYDDLVASHTNLKRTAKRQKRATHETPQQHGHSCQCNDCVHDVASPPRSSYKRQRTWQCHRGGGRGSKCHRQRGNYTPEPAPRHSRCNSGNCRCDQGSPW